MCGAWRPHHPDPWCGPLWTEAMDPRGRCPPLGMRWTVQPFSALCRGRGHVTVDIFCESAFLRKDPALWSRPQVAPHCGLTLPPTPAPSHPGSNSRLESSKVGAGGGGGSSLGRLRGGCLSSPRDLPSLRSLAPGPAAETQCRPLMKGPWCGACGQKQRPHTESC